MSILQKKYGNELIESSNNSNDITTLNQEGKSIEIKCNNNFRNNTIEMTYRDLQLTKIAKQEIFEVEAAEAAESGL